MSDARPTVEVNKLEAFRPGELNDLCDAADQAISGGGGFGWVKPPAREIMERYWKGVLAIPERSLFVGRLDGVIVGSAQLVRPPRNNEAQAFAAQLTTTFVAPWARGHGLARMLTEAVERQATADGFRILNLDVRESHHPALSLYETLGYTLWGTHPFYASVGGRVVPGNFFYKQLKPNPEPRLAPQ